MIRLFAFAGIAVLMTLPAQAQTAAGKPELTLDRFQQMTRTRLSQLDADGDGRISADEFVKRGAGRKSGAHGDPAKAFARFDTNHDGMLEPAEIDAMTAKRFARLDANHDGRLTADERKAMRAVASREQ